MLTIESLKSHVAAFAVHTGAAIEGEFHHALQKFAEFVEGKEALNDAVELLRANGYVVGPAPAVAT